MKKELDATFRWVNPIDIHIHAGPSVANRRVDAGEMYLLARENGYCGIVIKDHCFPSVMATNLISVRAAAADPAVFGCICLNNSVGGINVYAVDAACAMGAKIVFMPTVSARNHIEHHKKLVFTGAGKLKLHEKEIYYLDDDGELKPEVNEVLEFLAEYYPDVVLGTGHGSAAEIHKLIQRARQLGLTKILVNHPHYQSDATVEDAVAWADMGALIELNSVVFDDVVPADHHLPVSVAEELLRRVGYERIVIDSDLGQKAYMDPAEGLKKFAGVLMEQCGVTEEQLRVMMHDNPAKLLGLDI